MSQDRAARGKLSCPDCGHEVDFLYQCQVCNRTVCRFCSWVDGDRLLCSLCHEDLNL
jgi:hypothetical protein